MIVKVFWILIWFIFWPVPAVFLKRLTYRLDCPQWTSVTLLFEIFLCWCDSADHLKAPVTHVIMQTIVEVKWEPHGSVCCVWDFTLTTKDVEKWVACLWRRQSEPQTVATRQQSCSIDFLQIQASVQWGAGLNCQSWFVLKHQIN